MVSGGIGTVNVIYKSHIPLECPHDSRRGLPFLGVTVEAPNSAISEDEVISYYADAALGRNSMWASETAKHAT